MRSRYCAYVRRDLPYLMRTSHPTLRAKTRMQDLQSTAGLGWCGLTIVATDKGGADDSEGMIHFRAAYRGGIHDERSRFVKINGEWLYRDDRG
jgi:SEC-C motif domain protein